MTEKSPDQVLVNEGYKDVAEVVEVRLTEVSSFLESIGPGVDVQVRPSFSLDGNFKSFEMPDPIALQCLGKCDGPRGFSPDQHEDRVIRVGRVTDKLMVRSFFSTYVCRDCGVSRKRFALLYRFQHEGVQLTKYGETPPLRIHVPKRLRDLLRPDLDLLNKALASEAAGLGVGALVYYRRILENQKTRIFERIIKVAERIDAGEVLVAELRRAKDERQFTKALDQIGGAALKALYLDRHNPLTLLYDEISDGVHAGTDAESLGRAVNIRTVLGFLAERLEELLADRRDVDDAVAQMLKRKQERQEKKTMPAD